MCGGWRGRVWELTKGLLRRVGMLVRRKRGRRKGLREVVAW
jgi:hypothetical protein